MPAQSTFVISDVEKKLGMVAGGIRKSLAAAMVVDEFVQRQIDAAGAGK